MFLVWFKDLKLLWVPAQVVIGPSNPPHWCPAREIDVINLVDKQATKLVLLV